MLIWQRFHIVIQDILCCYTQWDHKQWTWDTTKATRVSLQSSNELLSRKYTLQGHSYLVLGLQDVTWAYQAEISLARSRNCLGKRYWNLRNTYRCQIASFRQTEHCCSTYYIDLPIPVGLKTDPLELMRQEESVWLCHSRCRLPTLMKHACIDWRRLAI